MSVKKIEYRVELDTDPVGAEGTIKVWVNVYFDVYFSDGRVYNDIPIEWIPLLKVDFNENLFTREERTEIEDLLNGYNNKFNKGVWYSINKLCGNIGRLGATGSLLKVDSEDTKMVNLDHKIDVGDE